MPKPTTKSRPALVALVMDPELRRAIKYRAGIEDVSVSEWIRQAIRERLGRITVSNTQTKGER